MKGVVITGDVLLPQHCRTGANGYCPEARAYPLAAPENQRKVRRLACVRHQVDENS